VPGSPIVHALLQPEAYDHGPINVELTQTQMSYVFLTGDYAFKIKKPVDLGYLDYTSLDNRHFFCNRELDLNRRLAPDVYLEVIPVVESGRQIRIGGEGTIRDYAVKMKQLPRDRMMDSLLINEQVTEDMVVTVAGKLADFHNNAESTEEIGAFGDITAIRENTDENFTQTIKYIGQSISSTHFNKINSYTSSFLEMNTSLFRKRVKEQRIKDCHGDLHAAHICFDNGIDIYDCIEFNDRFRYCDVASEVAFLAMDLDRYSRADLSKSFTDAYIESSGDKELSGLLPFYKCYRAYVRGKVESFKLDDPQIPDKDAVLAAAQRYFSLSNWYCREKPILVIIVGLVGTGKTAVARSLERSLGLPVISSDIVRKELAGIPPTEHRYDRFESGIYTDAFSDLTYDTMFNQARDLLSQGRSVVLDATFSRLASREQAIRIAEKTNSDIIAVECVLDEEVVKSRLERRLHEETASDAGWDIYEIQKQTFDRVTEFGPEDHVVIDTSQFPENITKIVMERILNR
jgi:aminoglycoside phosphotransferase family enzyme/predicted kinase